MKNLAQKEIFVFELSRLEKSFIARQMASMLRGGLSIPETLETIASHAKNNKTKQIIQSVRKRIVEGESIEKAMERHTDKLGEMFVRVVGAGEKGGTLAENLKFLARYFSRQHNMQSKVQGAISYPMIVLAMLGTLGIGAVFFVFPLFQNIFQKFGDVELPTVTRVFLAITEWTANNNYLIIAILVAVIVGTNLLLRIKSFRIKWDRNKLFIPVIGKLYWYSSISQFSYTLSALLSSGVSAVTALEVSANSITNKYIQQIIFQTRDKLEKGESLSISLKPHKRVLTPFLVSMVSTGEKSGNLAKNLDYVGDHFASELDYIAQTLPNTIGPILLVITGIGVAFFALSVFMPIFKLISVLEY